MSDLLALIAAYDDAWNRQDVEAISSMHAPDIVFHNHTAGEKVEGREAVAAHIAAIFERWPTLRFSGRGQRAGDDFVVSEWTASATHPDDGRRLEWDGVDVFPFRDGLIARKDVYSSSATPRAL
ncbi:MAG: nuclear transport factor 2 family protein [Gaiellales bacterium]